MVMRNVSINVVADGSLAAIVEPEDVLGELALVEIIDFCNEADVLDVIGKDTVIKHFGIKVAE